MGGGGKGETGAALQLLATTIPLPPPPPPTTNLARTDTHLYNRNLPARPPAHPPLPVLPSPPIYVTSHRLKNETKLFFVQWCTLYSIARCAPDRPTLDRCGNVRHTPEPASPACTRTEIQ